MRKIFMLCCLASSPVFATLQLSSSTMTNGAMIPAVYTCDGKNVSPPLTWFNIPTNTKSFALILSDSDAPNGIFYHWIFFNLPITVTNLPEEANLSIMAALGKNSWGKTQYNGPCPPVGETHRYQFTLYALDSMLLIPYGSSANSLKNAMDHHVLGQSTLTAVYAHTDKNADPPKELHAK